VRAEVRQLFFVPRVVRLVEPLFEPELRELVPEDRDAVVRLLDPLLPERDRLEVLFDVEPERVELRVAPDLGVALLGVALERDVVERELVERVEPLLVRLPERFADEPPEARPVVPERDDLPARPLVLRDVVDLLFDTGARVLVPLDRDAAVRLVPLRLVPVEEPERLAVPPLADLVVRAFDERDAELPAAERADPLLVRLRDPVPEVFDFRVVSFVDAVLFLGNV
jgi:hypothetical protein